ncbi:hypothetical protein D3C84_748570 [compost metagenome]
MHANYVRITGGVNERITRLHAFCLRAQATLAGHTFDDVDGKSEGSQNGGFVLLTVFENNFIVALYEFFARLSQRLDGETVGALELCCQGAIKVPGQVHSHTEITVGT